MKINDKKITEEEQYVDTIFEVWENGYNWDEQAEELLYAGEYKTEEEARKKADSIPSDSYSAGYFWIKTLGKGTLVITDSGNPKKADIPEDIKRPLTEEEIEFIRTLGLKSFRPSTYEIGRTLQEKFGENRINGYREQYMGTSNDWNEGEVFDDQHSILIEYDINTGKATISTPLLFLDRDKHVDITSEDITEETDLCQYDDMSLEELIALESQTDEKIAQADAEIEELKANNEEERKRQEVLTRVKKKIQISAQKTAERDRLRRESQMRNTQHRNDITH